MGTEMATFTAGCFWSVEAAFRCGTVRRDDGSVLIYYGGNDTVMNVGVTHEDVLIALCERYGSRHVESRRRVFNGCSNAVPSVTGPAPCSSRKFSERKVKRCVAVPKKGEEFSLETLKGDRMTHVSETAELAPIPAEACLCKWCVKLFELCLDPN